MNNQQKYIISLTFYRHGETAYNREGRFMGTTNLPLCKEGREELLKRFEEKRPQTPDILLASPMRRCIETAGILFPEWTREMALEEVLARKDQAAWTDAIRGRKLLTVSEWREMNFGRFEGQIYMELLKDPIFQQWLESGRTLHTPGGESKGELVERCERGMGQVVDFLRKLLDAGVDAAIQEDSLSGDGSAKCAQSPNWTREAAQGSLQAMTVEQEKVDLRVAAVIHGGTIMALGSHYDGGEYMSYRVGNGEGYTCKLLIGKDSFQCTNWVKS